MLVRDKLLPERFEALPLGTHVLVYLYTQPYDSKTRRMWGHNITKQISRTINTVEEKNQFLEAIKREIQPVGCTPYFDTLALVLEKIENEGWLDDPNVNLALYNYTDGLNETDGKGFNGSRFRYPSDNNLDGGSNLGPKYYAELDQATKDFNRDFGGKLKAVKEKGFFEELNVGTSSARFKVKQIPEYRVALALGFNKNRLKNPQIAAHQDIPLVVTFPD